MNDNISCKRLGNLNGHTGGNYAGQVFDVEGIAPTIRTPTGGGGLEPMIIEPQNEIIEPISTNSTDIAGCIRATYYKNGERNIIKNLQDGGYEGVIEPINTENDGTSRTIKAQYYKTSGANFMRTGDMGQQE